MNDRKNCDSNLKIRKYAFLIFQKLMSKEIAPGMLWFVSILLLIFEKGMSKKITQGFYIFQKAINKNNCSRHFKVRKYAFINI